MRTKNEIRLLVTLFLVVFAMANFYGYKWFVQKQNVLALTEKRLRVDKAEAEIDLKQQDIWAQRKAWIAQHEPVLGGKDGNAKAAEVLEAIRKDILDKHLEVLDQSPNETQQTPAGTRVNISIKIKGPMKAICEWLANLQKPESFYAVTRFSLKADQDQKSMVCTLQLAQYFKGGS